MSDTLILFDLPSRDGAGCWSLNPWKTRAALNFKGIPYRTEWVEYPDMAAKFQSFGLDPTTENSPSGYSIPAVRLSDGSYIMESRKIADALEALKPEPPLKLDSGYVERTQEAVLATQKALNPILMARVPELLLNPPSAEYFLQTRKKRFGMSLSEYAESSEGGETAWKNAQPSIGELVGLLREDEKGPYVMGKTPSYADLVLCGFMKFLSLLDKGDLWERFLGHDRVLAEHWKACQEYLERKDW